MTLLPRRGKLGAAEFFETSVFRRAADQLLTAEEQRALQNLLLERPDAGALIKKSGGLRKVRFGVGNKGKSGGVRVIYYHHTGRKVILLLVIYAKGQQDDLTDEQTALLRALVRKEFK